LLLAAVVAFALIAADIRFNKMTATRSTLSAVVYPFYWVSDLPSRLGNWSKENLVSRFRLVNDNARLVAGALMLEARVQQMAALRAENVRLRALLNSSALVQDDVLVAELIGISPDPTRHLVILNKGSANGVYIGQPLIDAEGLMGQVVEVATNSARVLLITDATHAIPVQVNRNGIRAIAEGVGLLDNLELRHVASTEDIQVGDLLVSSGLGGRFPVGYPVAVVTEVLRDPGQSFARVKAMPSAALNRSRHVLLVFTGKLDSEG
jgi:rod shape-determining protein MreC